MKKIISIIVVIILIAVVIYLYMTKSSIDTTPGEVVDTTTSISDAVDKSNPFDVKVDPYQGYKNPFGTN